MMDSVMQAAAGSHIGFVVALAFILAVEATLIKGLVSGDITPREAVGGSVAGGMFLALCA